MRKKLHEGSHALKCQLKVIFGTTENRLENNVWAVMENKWDGKEKSFRMKHHCKKMLGLVARCNSNRRDRVSIYFRWHYFHTNYFGYYALACTKAWSRDRFFKSKCAKNNKKKVCFYLVSYFWIVQLQHRNKPLCDITDKLFLVNFWTHAWSLATYLSTTTKVYRTT